MTFTLRFRLLIFCWCYQQSLDSIEEEEEELSEEEFSGEEEEESDPEMFGSRGSKSSRGSGEDEPLNRRRNVRPTEFGNKFAKMGSNWD